MDTPVLKTARKSSVAEKTRFVVLRDNPDGTTIWQDPDTLEEIRMNAGTAPTQALLEALAANGVVPLRPTVDDLPDDDFPPILDEEDNALSRVKEGSKEAFCGKFSIDEYDEHGDELIRSMWGAGNYRVRVYGPSHDGTGVHKFVLHANQLVEIEPSLIPLKSSLPGAPDPQHAALAVVTPVLNQMMEMMREMRGNSNGAPNGIAQLKEMAETMRALGMIGGKQPNISEMIREVRELKKLDGDLGGNGKEGGGKDSEPSMLGIASELIGALKPAMTAAQQQPQPQQMMLPAPGVEIPQSFVNDLEGEDVNGAQTLMFNILIGALVKAAQKNEPVDSHAAGLADKLPDQVLDMMELPIWFDMLCEATPKFAPDIQLHRQWFESLHKRLFEILDEPEDAPVTAAPVDTAPKVAARKR
jgi:hypothetical protein